MAISRPFYDGEQVPDDRVNHIFRRPPGMPENIARSTLLVGARGSGKTILLKHLAKKEPLGAVYLSLMEELGSVMKNAVPTDPSFAAPERVQPQAAKAACSLAIAILRETVSRNLTPALDVCGGFFPSSLRHLDGETTSAWLTRACARIAADSSEQFVDCDATRLVREAAKAAGAAFAAKGRYLTLLLDRADMVPPAIVEPVISLLDQSGPYLTVVATRPAPHANPDWGVMTSLRPTDHYDLWQLGEPASLQEKVSFFGEAIGAQYPSAVDGTALPREILEGAIYLSGHSVRLALDLVYQLLTSPRSMTWEQRFRKVIAGVRDRHRQRLAARLRPLDFPRICSSWRKRALGESKQLGSLVTIDVRTKGEIMLFGSIVPPSELDRFLGACLEDGDLHTVSGEGWYPGQRLRTVTVTPLLLWEEVDDVPRHARLPVKALHLAPSEVYHAGGRRPKRRNVFVALRFDFPESMSFYHKLKALLDAHPRLHVVDLHNGKAPHGEDWAAVVRERVQKCNYLAIGDVTGCRGDVLFELGIAYGLRRVIIPVVAKKQNLPDCPFWLTRFNVASYESDTALSELVNSIYEQVFPAAKRAPKLLDPIPHLTVGVGLGEADSQLADQVDARCKKEGVTFRPVLQVTSSNYESAIESAAKSRILLLHMNGTTADAFSSFASGIVVANPRAGYPPKLLHRRVIILAGRGAKVPDSVRRCQTTVSVVGTGEEALSCVDKAISEFTEWRQSK